MMSTCASTARALPELSAELDNLVEDPEMYSLAGASEATQREVRSSIETLMEVEVQALRGMAVQVDIRLTSG